MNKGVLNQNLITEYMILKHTQSLLLQSLKDKEHPTDADVEMLDNLKSTLEELREKLLK